MTVTLNEVLCNTAVLQNTSVSVTVMTVTLNEVFCNTAVKTLVSYCYDCYTK